MRKKSLSTLGYIMDYLNIQTVALSHAIHVDASLVSKWKTGNRKLTEQSVYFDDVIHYIMSCTSDNPEQLKNALLNFYPHEKNITESQLEKLLRQAVSAKKTMKTFDEQIFPVDNSMSVSSKVYLDSSGETAAIQTLLDYAESMSMPGEIIFFDSEEFSWLLEDNKFSQEFISRLKVLLDRGFHAKFIIHYTSYRDRFIYFFTACSPLIFNRNVEWFYYEDYSKNIFNVSIFLINKAISLLSISSNGLQSTTTVFTDSTLILRHEQLIKHTLIHCNPLFTNFDLLQFTDVVDDLYQFRKRGALYCVLSAPAFITVNKYLLQEVLTANHVEPDAFNKCLAVNEKARDLSANYFPSDANSNDAFIFIFHLEKLLKRVTTPPFISRSLSLLCGKQITITPEQYAKELRILANALHKYNNLQIILASEKDPVPLPSINCWCRQNTWMLQMNQDGFRLSDELGIVNAVSTTIESYIRSVPPIRREKNSVRQYLLDLADECTAY